MTTERASKITDLVTAQMVECEPEAVDTTAQSASEEVAVLDDNEEPDTTA